MRLKKLLKVLYLIVLLCCFILFVIDITGLFKSHDNSGPVYAGERYDPTLGRLNSINKLKLYCDSLYSSSEIATHDSVVYANIVGEVLRKRFKYGYSYYEPGFNTLGWLLAPAIKKDLSAIVIPDDILKYPNASCSQQSIAGMELFKKKGYRVRKVSFYDSTLKAGHFCFEVYYNKGWHFFDPSKEPELKLMIESDRPSIDIISKNKALLDSLYYHEDPLVRNFVLVHYHKGEIDEFPAPRAVIYQKVTKFLSLTSFFWMLLAGWVLFRKRTSK